MAMPNALEQVCMDRFLIGHSHLLWPQYCCHVKCTDVAVGLSQPVPPSVREILTAYAAKASDTDREVLLAILQAKAAEDQVSLKSPILTAHPLTCDLLALSLSVSSLDDLANSALPR